MVSFRLSYTSLTLVMRQNICCLLSCATARYVSQSVEMSTLGIDVDSGGRHKSSLQYGADSTVIRDLQRLCSSCTFAHMILWYNAVIAFFIRV